MASEGEKVTKSIGAKALVFVENATKYKQEIQQVDKIHWIAGERLTEGAEFDIMIVDFYKFLPRSVFAGGWR